MNQQRIVVKVGTSTLTHDSGAVNLNRMEKLVRVLADLNGMGHQVILVSSWARRGWACPSGPRSCA